MTTIVVAHNSYVHRGGEDVCVDHEIAALSDMRDYEVRDFRIQNENAVSTSWSALKAPFGLGHEKQLEGILRQHRPAILHAHNLYPVLSPRIFIIAKSLGIKTVQTLHNYRPLCLNGLFMTPKKETCERCAGRTYWPGILRSCYRESAFQSAALAAHLTAARWKNWYKAVDLFLSPSAFLQEKYVEHGFPRERIAIQPHFIDPMPAETPSPPQPYVLYLGRLSPEKGLRWLLELFSKPGVPFQLRVAGAGPLEKEVRAACGSTIEFLGYVTGNQKDTALRHATALIFPSECYENFPLAIPEAQAMGVPVLVSDFGALPAMVLRGKTGYRYTPKNVDSFWAALGQIRQDFSSLERRTECQAIARQTYSKARFQNDRLTLYSRLLAN